MLIASGSTRLSVRSSKYPTNSVLWSGWACSARATLPPSGPAPTTMALRLALGWALRQRMTSLPINTASHWHSGVNKAQNATTRKSKNTRLLVA
jgi:hypothetical protein